MEKKDKGHCYFGNLHYHTNDASTHQLLCQNAKYNRKHPTEAEALLWEYLREKQLGVRFRRQHPVYDYIPDFVCLTLNLIIEVDGGYYTIKEQRLNDEKRDAYLASFGFHIIRFTNEEVLYDLNNVLNKIKTAMNKLSSENQSANTTPTAKIQEDISNFTSSPNISQDCPLGTPSFGGVGEVTHPLCSFWCWQKHHRSVVNEGTSRIEIGFLHQLYYSCTTWYRAEWCGIYLPLTRRVQREDS